MVKVNCIQCGREIEKTLYAISKSKTGRFYCDKKCEVKFRIGKPTGRKDSPETCAKRNASVRAAKATPESRAKRSAITKAKWEDPEQRAKMCAAINAPENLEKRSAASKRMWENPEHREKIRIINEDPECRARRSASTKAAYENPEHRAKMRALSNDPERIAKQSRAMTLRWSDPEERARYGAIIKELWTDPDYRAAVVSAGRKRYENPEFRAMQSIGAVNRIARNKNFRSKIEEKVETLFTELGLVRNVDFFTSKRFHSKDPDYVDGCFGMNVDLWFPALNLVVEMNGTFHHSDPRFYPDRSKLCETQRIGLARYERKLRWLASQNIRIMELWSNEDSLAEELLVWPIVAEILCIDEDFDALEGVLRKTISTNNSKRGPA